MTKNERDAEPRRTRRTREQARREILDVAQKRLMESGPEAVRLKEVAADLGISRQAILHHFENRESLMEALAEQARDRLREDLIQAFGDPEATYEPGVILDRVFATMGDTGHARLLAWRVLTQRRAMADGPLILQEMVRAVRSWTERRGGHPDPQEVLYLVRLGALAAFGEAIAGEVLDRSAGLPSDPAEDRRFHRWLGGLLVERLMSD
jgi:AcrR family transcriptional regulator